MPQEQAIAAPTPDDLQGQRWVADHAHLNPAARLKWLAACQRAGFKPDSALEVSGPLAALACVEAGLGFTFIQHRLARRVPAQVSLALLPWLTLEISVYAVWRKDDNRHHIHDFLQAVMSR